MPTKSCTVHIKATAADDATLTEGQFVALASVFDNVDAVGDVVKPGAFTENLAEWKASGDTIPVYWGHRMDDPDYCIGGVLDAQETAEGLQVKVQLDLDQEKASQVYRLLKGRRVNRMSFAYDVIDGGWGQADGQEAYELRKLKVYEVSVVQVPANPAAVVQDIKAAADRRRAALAGRKDTDPAVAALVAQVDQCVDDALSSLTAADAGMDALMALLSIPDLPDSDTDADDAAKRAAALLKSGRTLSAKNEGALKAALEKINAGTDDIKTVLASIDSDDDGKANPPESAITEEPDGAKVKPARSGPASLRLRTDLAAWCVQVDEMTAA